MTGQGWIKLHRRCADHSCLAEADELGVWCRLLMMAAWEPDVDRDHGPAIALERGQLAVSVLDWSRRLNIPHKRLRLILAKLRANGMIVWGQAKGKAATIVTICNYAFYQDREEEKGKAEGKAQPDQGQSKGQTHKKKEDSKNVEDSPPSSPPMAADAPPDKPASPQPQAAPPVQPEIRLEVEPEKPPEKPPKRKRRTEGTRLPDDWQLNDNGYAFASGKGLSHDDTIWEADKFRRYFLAAAGQRARKCDWDLTWESWVCRAVEDRGGSAARPGPGRRPSGADRGRGGPTGVMAWTSEVARQEQPMARKVVSW
jgi:hypothetical protein